jgi:hypothetical protein
MTPEDLEAIPGIDSDNVEQIRDAVVAYYGQYEEATDAVPQGEEPQEQPTLEMGEAGYNYSESEDGTATAALAEEERADAGPESQNEAIPEEGTEDGETASEVNSVESAKLNSAE